MSGISKIILKLLFIESELTFSSKAQRSANIYLIFSQKEESALNRISYSILESVAPVEIKEIYFKGQNCILKENFDSIFPKEFNSESVKMLAISRLSSQHEERT